MTCTRSHISTGKYRYSTYYIQHWWQKVPGLKDSVTANTLLALADWNFMSVRGSIKLVQN